MHKSGVDVSASEGIRIFFEKCQTIMYSAHANEQTHAKTQCRWVQHAKYDTDKITWPAGQSCMNS